MDEDKLDNLQNDRYTIRDKISLDLKSKNSIELLKRNSENNTQSNIVDESINSIICYKIVRWKFFLSFFLYLITLGIIYILARKFPKFYLALNCTQCKISESSIFVIVDEENGYHIVDSEYQNFYKNNTTIYTKSAPINFEPKKMMKNSKYLGEDYLNKNESIVVLNYRFNKYYYNESQRKFESVKLDITKFTNNEIHDHLGQGLKEMKNYNYLLNKFGENVMLLPRKPMYYFILDQLIHPFYIYQIYSITIWLRESYNSFCIVVIVAASMTLLLNAYQQYKNYNKLIKDSTITSSNIVRDINEQNENRKFANFKYDVKYMVPGDLIELSNGKVLPCDCVLIEGLCTVNESQLTGESSLVMKTSIPFDDNKFDYKLNYKSVLYAGTLIDKCESFSKKGKIFAIVINTGFNTQKGNLIQSVLFPKPSNSKYYMDIIIFTIGMLVIYLAAVITVLHINSTRIIESEKELTPKLIQRCFDIMTIVIPASLPICMTFSSYFFQHILNINKISCVNDKRLNAAGRVNIVIFDKTGTLTEEALELCGFQTTFLSNGKRKEENHSITEKNEINLEDIEIMTKIELDEIEKTAKVYKHLYRKFWKDYFDQDFNFPQKNLEYENYKQIHRRKMSLLEGVKEYQNNPKFNLIYFFECLGTCHSIDKLNEGYFGNNIDKTIFENLGWILLRSDENFIDCISSNNHVPIMTKDQYVHYYTMPKKSYKITEDYVFKNLNNNFHDSNKNFKLKIVKRFDFSSKFQTMSVIVQNSVDKSFRYYIKGAPEKIHSMCMPDSIPVDFFEQLMNHTNMGLRVIACATKILQRKEKFYEYETDRYKYENNLSFLGFIIFKNKIKKDSKHVIAKLRSNGCKLIISTGDNPFTSISVGRECGFFSKSSKILLVDFDKSKKDFLHFSYINHTKEIEVFDESDNENLDMIKEEKIKHLEKNTSKNKKVNPETSRRKLLVDIKIGDNVRNDDYSSNHFFELDNLKNFISFCNDLKGEKFAIGVSGSALNYLYIQKEDKEKQLKNSKNKKIFFSKKEDDQYKDLVLFFQIIEKHGRVFYRMSPQDKIDLVNLFKKNTDNIVSMCGDGANDCGALMCADVGIYLNRKESPVTQSHFNCKGDSITKVEIILKVGRACIENNMIVFKIMILYAIIQLATYTLLYISYSDLTNNQYFFVDFGIVFTNCILISRTRINFKPIKEKPTMSILNFRFYFSVVGQVVIQLGLLCAFYFVFLLPNITNVKANQAELDKSLAFYNSYMLLLTFFQYSVSIYVFNDMAKHKKGNMSNKTYILYLSFLSFFVLNMLTVTNFSNFSANWDLILLVKLFLKLNF